MLKADIPKVIKLLKKDNLLKNTYKDLIILINESSYI